MFPKRSRTAWQIELDTLAHPYTRELMNPGDNPPISIVLCAEKNNTVVEYTLPKDEKQIFAAKYLTYFPTEEELRALLGN